MKLICWNASWRLAVAVMYRGARRKNSATPAAKQAKAAAAMHRLARALMTFGRRYHSHLIHVKRNIVRQGLNRVNENSPLVRN